MARNQLQVVNPAASTVTLGDIWGMREAPSAFEPVIPNRTLASQLRYALFDRWANAQQAHAISKGLEMAYVAQQKRAMRAAEQDAVINPTIDYWSSGTSAQGVSDVTGTTFSELRRLAAACEPVACIVNTRVGQVAAFARKAEYHKAHAKTPGFRVRLTDKDAQATPEDKKQIAILEQFLEETGFVPPPENEQPDGWEPGLEPFLKRIVRDRLTLDWVSVRRWRSKGNPDKFPIVSFAAVDSSLIRRTKTNTLGVTDGREIKEPYDAERHTRSKIKYVKMEYEGGRKLEEYTAAEMFCACFRPRTDESAHGYGYSELEEAINAVSGWISSRDYNLLRFDKDSLPRGVMSILGNLNQQQFDAFTIMWKQMFEGKTKRWAIPIIRGTPMAGSSVNWTPFDLSNREMEYSQFLFTLAIWLHAIYQIHPDETGFSAASPFRPALSEASPEVSLEYSQDKGLSPLLNWIASLINRNILWVLDTRRRYTFEFVGTGQWDELQDTQTRVAQLNGGLSTWGMQWAELDQPIPESLKDSPIWDLNPAFLGALQQLQSMQQSQQQGDMQEQQQQAQMQQQMLQAHNATNPAAGQDMSDNGPGGPGMTPGGQGEDDQPQEPVAPGSTMCKSYEIDLRV